MKITLRQVEIFLAVAERTHFARAAEALHLSQPTVSQEVQRLERALGVQLFDRTTRSASLTGAGLALMEESRELLAAATRLTEKSALLSPQRAYALRVVASPSIVNRLLPEVISEAERQLSDVRVEDVLVDTGGVEAGLLDSGGDIGLGRFLSPPSGFLKETLVQEPVAVTLSAPHAQASQRAIDLKDLGDLPLLLWPREQSPAYYDALLDICQSRGLTPLVLVSPPLIVGARSYLMAEGRAFSLVPRSATAHLSSALRAVDLKVPATLPLDMLYRSQDPRSFTPRFREIVRARARTLGAARGGLPTP